MVGGKIDSVFYADDRVIVTVVDGSDVTGINLAPTDELLQAGDGLWWQGDFAYWTPQDRSQNDVALPRLGYSYAVEND